MGCSPSQSGHLGQRGAAWGESPQSISAVRNSCLVTLLVTFSQGATIKLAVERIYLDHNATTPVAPACVDAMAAALREEYGNPSSVHYFGQKAKAVVDEARSRVAELINADPSEVVFTSGGTESDNLAIRGAAEALEPAGRRQLVASSIEHEAVLNTLKALGRRGWEVSWLGVGESGVIDPEALRAVVGDRTARRLGDARQQRGGHHPARGRAGQGGQGGRRRRPRGRRAVGRQDPARRQGARRRSGIHFCTQVLRAEGHRRTLDPARRPAGGGQHRRAARARPARRHRERGRHRRHGRRGAAGARPPGRGGGPPGGAPRSARGGHPPRRLPAPWSTATRPARAQHHQHQLRPRRGRVAAHRPRPGRASPYPRARRAPRARSSRRTC